jgi:hypothetical protein
MPPAPSATATRCNDSEISLTLTEQPAIMPSACTINEPGHDATTRTNAAGMTTNRAQIGGSYGA